MLSLRVLPFQVSVVLRLLKKGTNVNVQDSEGNTALVGRSDSYS